MQQITKSLISLVTSGCLFIATCETSSIGVVKSTGDFKVNSAALRSNSTLFDGNMLETAAVRSEVQLSNGTRVTLTPESRAKLFRNRTILEKGSSEVKNAGKYEVSALGMTMVPQSKDTVMQVAMNRPQHVSVSALVGAVEVRSASGMLIARVMPDMALEFDPQVAGAATASHLTGCMVDKAGKYFLTDETTNLTVEVQGNGVEKAVGSRVELIGSTIPGATPGSGATQLVSATDINKLGACGKKKAAAAAGGAAAGGAAAGGAAAGAAAGGAAAAGAAAGLSAGAIVAVVGGVAVAGTVVATKAAGVWGDNSSASPN